jgi:hypothetical protein
MAARWLRSGWSLAVFVPALFLAVVGSVVYSQQELVVAHWHSWRYLRSTADSPDSAWLQANRSLSLPIAAESLAGPDAHKSRRAGELVRAILSELKDPTDPDSVQLSLVAMAKFRDSYASFNAAARLESLEASHLLLRLHLERWSPHVATVLDSAGEIFLAALADEDLAVKETALRRLPSLWRAIAVDGSAGPLVRAWLYRAYQSAIHLTSSMERTVRLAAAVACCHAPFADEDYRIARLLDDEDVTVRKGVLVALSQSRRGRLHGMQKHLVAAWLGDSDPAAVAAAERVLRTDGIPAEKVELLKLKSSATPETRARAAAFAVELSKRPDSDFDPTGVLLQLSEDQSPEVRLAAVQAAVGSPAEAVVARLRSMSRNDSDVRVRSRALEVLKKHP